MRIVSRAEWGARYGAGFGPAPLPAREVWLHHTASSTPPVGATLEEDCRDVRGIERIGQQRFQGGISYSFLVAPSGRVFEGHGIDRRGAHTKGRNSIARAICLLGNYEVSRPSPEQVEAVVWLVAHGAAEGWWPARLAGGHRDAPNALTACPGRFAYALIGDINDRVAGRLSSSRPTPRPSQRPAPPPAPLPAAVVPAGAEEDDVHIPLTPDPSGGFRAAVKVEVGAGTAAGYDEGWLSLASTWGSTDYVVTALAADAAVLRQWNSGRTPEGRPLPFRVDNNRHWVDQLPDGTRTVTVEGSVAHLGAVPAAAVWHVR